MIARGQLTRRTTSLSGMQWARTLTLALTVVSIVAALAGCGQAATAHSGATATPRVTGAPDSVIRQGPQATWQQVTLPAQVDMPIAIAPADGDVAYACAVAQPKGDGITHTWVTSDRGQHWTAGGDIAGPTGAATCHLTVDDDKAAVVTATLNTASGGSSPPIFTSESSYASFDGGATWRKLGAGETISHVASYNGLYYAARVYEACAACPILGNLAVSSDQMQTWQLVGPDQNIGGSWFWLSPLTGSLLVLVGDPNGINNGDLMRSDDGGAHWSVVQVPPWAENLLAVPQAGAEPWQLCAVATALAGAPADVNQLACSADGGQTWTVRPALRLTNLSPKGFTYKESAFVVAIAGDGAILATASDSNAVTHLYRLPSGSSTWQTLGPLNGIASCGYSSGPGAGVLWQTLISSPTPYLTATYP